MYISINFDGRHYETLIVKVKFYESFVAVLLLLVSGLNKIIYLHKIWKYKIFLITSIVISNQNLSEFYWNMKKIRNIER